MGSRDQKKNGANATMKPGGGHCANRSSTPPKNVGLGVGQRVPFLRTCAGKASASWPKMNTCTCSLEKITRGGGQGAKTAVGLDSVANPFMRGPRRDVKSRKLKVGKR